MEIKAKSKCLEWEMLLSAYGMHILPTYYFQSEGTFGGVMVSNLD